MTQESEPNNEPGEDAFLEDCLADLPAPTQSSDMLLGLPPSVMEQRDEIEPDSEEEKPAPERNEAAELQSEEYDLAGDETRSRSERAGVTRDVHPVHLATSTFLSLVMVLVLLLLARLIVPSLVESVRYGWYRGQLRAEYELSGQRLKSVSLDSLADVSQLVSQRMGASVVHIDLLPDDASLAQLESLLGRKPSKASTLAGQGSGFVIDKSGYIMTNYHVVENVGNVEVTLSDGRRLPARIVGTDEMTDLAVLKVEANDLLPIEWGSSDEVIVGTPVWAVGSPFGLQQTVTFGIISGKHRVDFRSTKDSYSLNGRGNTPYGDLMQSDVALNPGNSGGPLVNSLGQVVGVNAAILGDTFRGISFSIPSRVAKAVAGQLIEKGLVPRGWLGVKLEDLADDEKFLSDGVPRAGVRVSEFPAGIQSPARKAGIRTGDIIVAFEGIPVADSASLIRLIGETEAGTTVNIELERSSEIIAIQVLLAQRDPSLR